MPNIDITDYGQSRIKLMPDDLKASPCRLTIATVEEVEVPDQAASDGLRKALTLTFTEFPEQTLWLNKSQIETLIHRLGNNTDRWIGATVPIESYVAEYRGQRFPKVRVAPEEHWDALLAKTKGSNRPRAAVKASRGRR